MKTFIFNKEERLTEVKGLATQSIHHQKHEAIDSKIVILQKKHDHASLQTSLSLIDNTTGATKA